MAVVLINVPAINYSPINGLSFYPLQFQVMGISFGYIEILSASWTFGLPLSGLYWFWKLRSLKKRYSNEYDFT